MIIKFLGHECDDEQIEMMYEVGNVTNDDIAKIKDAIDKIQEDPEWEDSDYEDIIEEAMNIVGINSVPITHNFEIQL